LSAGLAIVDGIHKGWYTFFEKPLSKSKKIIRKEVLKIDRTTAI
jgi:hypothetical protein